MTDQIVRRIGVSVKEIERLEFAGEKLVRAKVHFGDGDWGLASVDITVSANDEVTLAGLERLLIERAHSICGLVASASIEQLMAMAQQTYLDHDFGRDRTSE
jgi:hypothetical protein